jgi:hypothetical protein
LWCRDITYPSHTSYNHPPRDRPSAWCHRRECLAVAKPNRGKSTTVIYSYPCRSPRAVKARAYAGQLSRVPSASALGTGGGSWSEEWTCASHINRPYRRETSHDTCRRGTQGFAAERRHPVCSFSAALCSLHPTLRPKPVSHRQTSLSPGRPEERSAVCRGRQRGLPIGYGEVVWCAPLQIHIVRLLHYL